MAAAKPAVKKPVAKAAAPKAKAPAVKSVPAKKAPVAKPAPAKKAAAVEAEVIEDAMLEVGTPVRFLAFTSADPQDLPDNAEALVEGETYVITQVNEATAESEASYIVEAPNPNFDDSKKASKTNPATVEVDVFSDEIEAVEEGDEEAGEEEAAEEVAEEEVEAPAPKAKAAAKKPAAAKPAAKAAPAKKAPAKKAAAEQEEQEAEDPELKGMILLTEEEEDADVLEMVNGTEDICGLAQELRNESAISDYRLGGVLYHVRLTKAYKQLDDAYAANKGFALYVEEQLGLHYRKAMYLVDIYAKFSKFGIGGDKVAELGWTKCQEIARLMDESNAEELVALAEEHTVESLKDAIKESYGTEGGEAGERVKRHKYAFLLVEESAEVVTDYLEQAKESLNLDSLDQVFEHIVTEWAQEHLNAKRPVGKAAAKTTTVTARASAKK